MVELEKRFFKDFSERFGGLAMIGEDAKKNMSPLIGMQTCTQEEIKKWVDNWTTSNAGIEKHAIDAFNFSVGLEFKRVKDLERENRRME